jgi:zinc and cadmium transporter
MFASLSGVLFTWKTLGRWLTPRLQYLIAVAGGVFVVIIFNLFEEATHEGITVPILVSFIFGAVLLQTVTILLPKDAHHHDSKECGHTHTQIDARRVLISDAVHNIHDGLTLMPAFLVSPVVGFGTALGIFLHEVVQEISEFFILKEAGYSTKKALLWNFLVSGTLLIGIALALFVASLETFSTLLVAFSAGGFSYILFKDLLPSIVTHAKKERSYRYFILSFCIGFILMTTVTLLVPHTEHADEEFLLPEGFGLAYSSNTPSHF